MDSIPGWLSRWSDSATALLEDLTAHLPSLAGALALALLGWLVAWLVRGAIYRFGNGINGILDRFLRQGSLARVRLSSGALRVTGTIVFWIVLFLFIAEAAHVARFEALASWLDRIFSFIPTLIGGGLIILAGYIVSTLVRDIVASSMSPGGESQAKVAAFIAQATTFLVAIVIGIDQIGIDVTFLVTIVSILLGGTFVGLAVAFGLGARVLVSNLIGAHELRQHYSVGQTVCLGTVDGEILEITSTSVIVETGDGRVIVPARVFHEQSTTLRIPQA